MNTTAKPPSPRMAYRFENLLPLPAGMSGPSREGRSQHADARPRQGRPTPDIHALAGELTRSLQLARASTLALTRLQLAIKSSDRRQTMEALDRLHTIDTDLERLTGRLPAPPMDAPDRPEWDAIASHLDNQKLALACEKLALASGISGPDLVGARPSNPGQFPPAAMAAGVEQEESLLPAVRQPPWKRNLAIRILGVAATLLVMFTVAALAVAMMRAT